MHQLLQDKKKAECSHDAPTASQNSMDLESLPVFVSLSYTGLTVQPLRSVPR